MEGWKGPRDFRRESVNESRKRSMERRNEYEINSIPPSAAWRATPCIYMRSPGKLSPFCLSPFLSPPLHASPRHSFHFSRPLAATFLLAISSLPPSLLVFLSDFSRVLSHNSTVSYQEPLQRQWTNGRRKVG